jgi:hypothetical protein
MIDSSDVLKICLIHCRIVVLHCVNINAFHWFKFVEQRLACQRMRRFNLFQSLSIDIDVLKNVKIELYKNGRKSNIFFCV